MNNKNNNAFNSSVLNKEELIINSGDYKINNLKEVIYKDLIIGKVLEGVINGNPYLWITTPLTKEEIKQHKINLVLLGWGFFDREGFFKFKKGLIE